MYGTLMTSQAAHITTESVLFSGPGKSYNIFAGKDGSRGLGMSSLEVKDAVADYSTLDEKDSVVLDDWVRLLNSVGFKSAHFCPFSSNTLPNGTIKQSMLRGCRLCCGWQV